jgi:hypothetical protein
MPYDDNGNWSSDQEPSVDAGAVVTQMYEAILGRAPDAGGFQAFVDAINSGVPVSQLAQSMASSQEAQNNAASGQGPSQEQVQNVVQQASSDPGTFVQQASTNQANKDYVTALYQAVLGRAPDAQGLQDNLNALANGSITPQQLAQSFASSPEAGSNKIPAAQEKQMAQSLAESYGKPSAQVTTDNRGYPSNWENVSPTQLVKMGITNPVILKAAAEGKLDNPTFGALGLDARAVQNSINSGTALPQEFIKAQESTKSSFTPNGKVTATKMANANQAVYYFSDGSTALVNRDGTIDHITPPVSNYRQQEGSIARADNPGYVMFNGQMVKVETPPLTYDPQAGKVVQNDKGMPSTYDPGPQGGGPGALGWVSGNLANFDKGVSTAIPGGWTTIALVAASALSAGTLAPMASTVGGAILGSTTAVGATTLGTAIIGASTSALMAAATGGDVGKAALMGAIGGAVGANSGDIAAKLVGGAENIAAIAQATGQTTAQVSNLITNAVSTGISAAAAGKGDIASMIGATLASTAVGNYTGNIMRSLDSSVINSVANSVSTVARVGTTAALAGKDPQQAITNSMGQIIGNMVSQNLIQPGINATKNAIKNDTTTTPTEKTDAQKNAQLVDDGFKQIVQQFAQSTGKDITPEQIDQYIALQQPKYQTELPNYFSTASTITSDVPQPLVKVPTGTVEISQIKSPPVDNPIVSRTPNLDGGETIKYQSGDVLVKDANGDVVSETPPAPPVQQPVETPVNPNQNLLDTMWQDYMTGLRSTPEAKGTNFSMGNFNAPTDTVGGAGGTDGTGATTGPGNGAGTGNTAGTGTGSGGTGTGFGGTGTVTGSIGGGGTSGTRVVNVPGSIKKVTSSTTTPIIGTIPSVFGAGDISHLTPGLVKGSEFKFASEPTFTEQVNPVQAPQPYDYSEQILNAATGGSTNTANTIEDLRAGLVKGTPFKLASEPKFLMNLNKVEAPPHIDYSEQILNAAMGGQVNGYASGGLPEYPEDIPTVTGKTLRGRPLNYLERFHAARMPGFEQKQYAEGGDVEGHNPQFFSVGGLNSMENTYVQGEGDGTSDSVPAMLADGEFVIPADVVSKLGNGSNNAGAKVLDGFLSSIRTHAQDHDPKKLPPESKGPLAYLLDAKRKVG